MEIKLSQEEWKALSHILWEFQEGLKATNGEECWKLEIAAIKKFNAAYLKATKVNSDLNSFKKSLSKLREKKR